MSKVINKIKHLSHSPSAAGVLLMLVTVLALIISNSGVSWYGALLETKLQVRLGDLDIHKPLILWINDGLMAIFFLMVGLELKREISYGHLSNPKNLAFPIAGALGGLSVPAIIYFLFNSGSAVQLNGWAIPAATDIAFALGILALVGSNVPTSLKILLTSIAIIDDLAAVVIIALFYTSDLSMFALIVAGLSLVFLFALNRLGVKSLVPYFIIGTILWVAVLKSGVHATLAGVALAFMIPQSRDKEKSVSYSLEKNLHGWVALLIIPIFAFANAGISLQGITFEALLQPVTLGIALGLLLGKQIGVFAMIYLMAKLKLAALPQNVTWKQIYGLSLLCGVGFTMSLFISSLAFEESIALDFIVQARIGILVGSLISGILGFIVLKSSVKGRPAEVIEA
ncbi:Na+/H+ antiporter NhaA [Akkermansiaceae bacterium]|nr:Na+/H+ antiporter NhaA [Akkermansiaceae bacterium]